MEKKLKDAIDDLLQGTSEEIFHWEPTERKTEFRLRLKNGIVTVDCWDANDDPFDDPSHYSDITFYKDDGEVIERFVYSQKTEASDYQFLQILNDAARRNSLKIDEKLELLFKEIHDKSALF